MDTLVEGCNEETLIWDASLLQSSSVLVARPAAPVLLASPLVANSVTCGDSAAGLHCDHFGRDGHVDAFSYRKKKDQKAPVCRSSHGTGSSSSVGSKRSFAGSKTQGLLMLLHRLAASMSLGAVGSVT
jgi:hypothetical protein